MLSAEELASMRDDIETALPDTAILSGGTVIADGAGGGTVDFAAFGTVSARIAPIGGGEGPEIADRLADESTHMLTLPFDTDLSEADRVTVASTVYEVTLVRERGAWEISRRVEVKESA